MKVYCTSKNNGPESSQVSMIYLGASIEVAEDRVGIFSKYQKDTFPVNFINLYSALPRSMDWEMIQFYAADGYWYSIVMFELKETVNAG